MKKFSEIYNKKACLEALTFGLGLGIINIFFSPIERTGPLTWQFACGTILISTVFGLIFFPPFNAFSKRFQNITSEIYNKKTCLISLIIGVIIGAIFTFYPPFGRTEPLTLLLAGRTFVIWVVCALVLCPNLFAIFRRKKQE
ncbi:MAG: hypothetical protein MJZ98_06975 [Paludibacteraceae bacterium]|nr:hypothetical protein [Paludibacteraceae bacterium]